MGVHTGLAAIRTEIWVSVSRRWTGGETELVVEFALAHGGASAQWSKRTVAQAHSGSNAEWLGRAVAQAHGGLLSGFVLCCQINVW